jgi:hypothetical protein
MHKTTALKQSKKPGLISRAFAFRRLLAWFFSTTRVRKDLAFVGHWRNFRRCLSEATDWQPDA